jgi:hypothetical protein
MPWFLKPGKIGISKVMSQGFVGNGRSTPLLKYLQLLPALTT